MYYITIKEFLFVFIGIYLFDSSIYNLKGGLKMVDLNPINPQIIKLGSPDVNEALGALSSLKSQGEKIIPMLLEQLNSNDDSIRTMIIVILGEFGQKAASSSTQISSFLLEDNEQLRMATALTLTRIGVDSIVPLRRILYSDNQKARFWAVWAMSFLAPEQIDIHNIEFLKKYRKYSYNPVESFAAEEAIAKIFAKKIQI